MLLLLFAELVEGVSSPSAQLLEECRLDNLFHVFLHSLLGMHLQAGIDGGVDS